VEEVFVVSVIVAPSGIAGTAALAVATPRMATDTALKKSRAARPMVTVWRSS
jgi:Mg/Co/Ni transporter MgtE